MYFFVNRKHKTKSLKQASFLGQSCRNFNKVAFQNCLRHTDWNNLHNESDPQKAWLHNESYLDKYCPLRDIRFNKMKEEWVDNESLERKHDNDKMLKKPKKNKKLEDWIQTQAIRN